MIDINDDTVQYDVVVADGEGVWSTLVLADDEDDALRAVEALQPGKPFVARSITRVLGWRGEWPANADQG